MKIKFLLINLFFMTSCLVMAQKAEPIFFGNEVATNLDEDKLYSEFNKLFDEFSEDCHSRRINSRYPFINLLESALEESGSELSINSKKIKRADKSCSAFIIDYTAYTFDHYYKHYCKLSFLTDADEILSVSQKGELVAGQYFDDFENECNNGSSKRSNSKILFNEWNTGVNVWSKLLTDKVNDIYAQRKIAEEERLKRLAAEEKAKEDARIAELEKQRLQQEKAKEDAKIAEIKRQNLQEEQKIKDRENAKRAAQETSNAVVEVKKPPVNSEPIDAKLSSEKYTTSKSVRNDEIEKQNKSQSSKIYENNKKTVGAKNSKVDDKRSPISTTDNTRKNEVDRQKENNSQRSETVKNNVVANEARTSEVENKQPSTKNDGLIKDSNFEKHQETVFILVVLAFFAMLIAGSTNKIVIYYDINDFLISFVPWASLILGFILVSVYQEGEQSADFSNLSVLQTLIWYSCIVISGLSLIWSIRLSILHNRNTVLGLFVGVFKVLSSLLGVIVLIGSLNKMFDKDAKTKDVNLGVLVILVIVWLGNKLINGERVYLAKGWRLPG